MATSPKWKLLCLVLFLGNALTLHLLFRARSDYSAAQYYLSDYEFRQAMKDADHDFSAGTLRLYKVDAFATNISRFTGQKDGALEIWTRPYYRPDPGRSPRVELAQISKYVDTYNERMHILYARLLERTNPRPSIVSDQRPPDTGLPVGIAEEKKTR
jgi:hypothetical protein